MNRTFAYLNGITGIACLLVAMLEEPGGWRFWADIGVGVLNLLMAWSYWRVAA